MTGIKIHAVEMVRAIRDQLYEETKLLTPEELRAFIAREAGKVVSADEEGGDPSTRPAA